MFRELQYESPQFGIVPYDSASQGRSSAIVDAIIKTPVVRSVVPKSRSSSGFLALAQGLMASERSGSIQAVPEFDMQRVAKLMMNEEMFQNAVQKTVERVMNAGWTIQSRDPGTIKYIKDRLHRIADTSGQPFEGVLDDILRQASAYSNAMIYKTRGEVKGARPVRIEGKNRTIDPIMALEVLDTTNALPWLKKSTRRISRWEIRDGMFGGSSITDLIFNEGLGSNSRIFRAEDVAHIAMFRQPGFLMGCPFVLPTVGDIVELRKLEELMGIIAYQRAYPLLQVRVGTDLIPAFASPDGIQIEVSQVASKFETLSLEGVVCTDHRTVIEKVLDGYDVDKMMPLLEYYRTRVSEGLGLSSLDKGDNSGTSRSSAKELSKEGVSRANYIAEFVERAVNFGIIDDIQREGGIDPHDERYNGRFNFNSIDQGERIAEETHQLSLFHGNVITFEEMREKLSRYPLTPAEEGRLYFNVVELVKAEETARVAAKYGVPAGGSSDSGGESKATQKTRGTNQHGGKKPGEAAKD